ncbi:tetratricopeptide repeat protein [Aliiglaciecola lipolytica]|uniref:Uncharacterized protein n=1 Tax=Aliiglaciecola lipolytica E3 TaxID=1127673 RepID=K6YFZ7_9ALTE|nr:tetratricopeptide repeat protein [Aliiglaciecola lipolytica]GAC15558.1 hypothetical protein GLIP_2937 [Aliiglaciecola lipolytica E3]
MRFSKSPLQANVPSWLIMLLMVTVLPGCASFDQIFTAQPDPQPVEKSLSSGDTNQTDGEPIEAQPLDPMQVKVQALRAQPNLYLSGSTPVKASVKYQFDQALAAKQENNLALAKQLFQALISEQPKLSGPWVQLGDLSMQQFNQAENSDWDAKQVFLEAAKSDYEKALRLNQNNYFAHNRLAKVYREMGQFEQAEQHYNYAISSYPAYDNAYLNLGILYDLYMGKKQLALDNYELYQALQDEPIRQVKGWIADLGRQIAKAKKEG